MDFFFFFKKAIAFKTQNKTKPTNYPWKLALILREFLENPASGKDTTIVWGLEGSPTPLMEKLDAKRSRQLSIPPLGSHSLLWLLGDPARWASGVGVVSEFLICEAPPDMHSVHCEIVL